MVVKEFDYINGNTAARPRRSDDTDRRKYEELQRAKRQRNKRIREDQKKKRKGIRQIAMVILVLGMISIAGEAKVYVMQNEISGTNHKDEDKLSLNQRIKILNDDNEALRVELLKVASLDNIKTKAEERLGMVIASKDDMKHLDLSENYFEDLENDRTDDKQNGKGLFSKLMDALD